MKKLITIIIIVFSFYSCTLHEEFEEVVNVSFDIQDNVMKYGSNDWAVNLDSQTKVPVNKVGLERTDYGFVLKSKVRIVCVKLFNRDSRYSVDYSDSYNVKVTGHDELYYLFYLSEVIELELTILN